MDHMVYGVTKSQIQLSKLHSFTHIHTYVFVCLFITVCIKNGLSPQITQVKKMKKNYKQIYAIEINIPLKWTHYLKDVS